MIKYMKHSKHKIHNEHRFLDIAADIAAYIAGIAADSSRNFALLLSL